MYVPFETLPESARIWIYQSGRSFSELEAKTISENLLAFTNQWAAHGEPLKSSFKIEHNQFVIVSVDEGFSEASGCSIDASTHVFKELGHRLKLDFFDRTNVAFFDQGKVMSFKMNELSQALEQGKWNKDTLTFNMVVSVKGDLERWKTPASDTWLKRYLTKVTAF